MLQSGTKKLLDSSIYQRHQSLASRLSPFAVICAWKGLGRKIPCPSQLLVRELGRDHRYGVTMGL